MDVSSRRRRYSFLAIVSLSLLLLLITLSATISPPSRSNGVSATNSINHVIVIMMENKLYTDVIGSSSAPYINSLANKYALATNYYGVEYPSLPNYIDISSGSNGGITTDCDSGPASGGCETSNTNIFNLLKQNSLTWKLYAESMPSPCYASDSGNYLVHHNPVPYYTSISSSDCNAFDIPMGSPTSGNFYNDVKGGTLPNLSFIVPNECDDMHTVTSPCSSNSIATGDTYLSQLIPLIQGSSQYSSTVIIITWDTGSGQTGPQGGHVPTIVVGPSSLVTKGSFGGSYNHYSTLATIETIFGVGNLGRNDASVTPLAAITGTASSSSSTTTTQASSSSSSSTAQTSSSSSTTGHGILFPSLAFLGPISSGTGLIELEAVVALVGAIAFIRVLRRD